MNINAPFVVVSALIAAFPQSGLSPSGSTNHDDQIRIEDQRPPTELKDIRYSRWMFSCDFGLYALGDKGGAGQRIPLLQDDLQKLMTGKIPPKRIVIHHYLIILNYAAQQTAEAIGVGLGSQGLPSSFNLEKIAPKCAKDKMTIGWFSASELSHATSPLIVYIDAEVDGQPIKVRSLYSPLKNPRWDKNYGRPEAIEAIHAAYHKANEQLADDITRAVTH